MTSLHPSTATPTVMSRPLTMAEAPDTVFDASTDTADQDMLIATEQLLGHFTRRHRRPWHLWGPRLGALMLMRVGEVAHLVTGDLTSISCRWFLHVQRGPAGVLEAPRRRVIPIPPALVRAGFVEFVQQQPRGSVFPDLRGEKPEMSIDHWVRVEAGRHADPRLRHFRFGDLRKAGVAAIERLPGGSYASAAMRGTLATACSPEEVDRYETLRHPLELSWFVDEVIFPEIGGRVVPLAARLRWKGQRVVRMEAAP